MFQADEVPPGRADREDGALDAIIGDLRDNKHGVTHDVRRWHGTSGARAGDRLAQRSATGHMESWTPENTTHFNLASGKAGSQGATSAGQAGGRRTHHSAPVLGGPGEPLGGCRPRGRRAALESRVRAAGGEGDALSPSRNRGGCIFPRAAWLHPHGTRGEPLGEDSGSVARRRAVSGSKRHRGDGGLSEATMPRVCQPRLAAPAGKGPYFLQQQKRGGSWQSSSPGISLAFNSV